MNEIAMRWGPPEEDKHGYPVAHDSARRIAGGFAWSYLDFYVAGHGGGPTVTEQTDADFLERGPRLDVGLPALREMVAHAGGDPIAPPRWLLHLELTEAARAGDRTRMESLLRAGALPDAAPLGKIAVVAAIAAKRFEAAVWLLEHGARPATYPPGVLDTLTHAFFHQGRGTPGWGELFEALVAAGLDMRSKIGGNALLAETDPRMVTRLLALGATPDRTYAGGSTALHAACMRGPWSSVPFAAPLTPRGTHAVADLLIAAGVPVDAVATSGRTALRDAVESGSVAALRSLLEAGADRNLAPMPSHLARCGTPFPTPLQRARELARDPEKEQLALEMVALLEAAQG